LVPMIFFDSLVMPQPTSASGTKHGMRVSSRPDGKPSTRMSPVWPPLQSP
jgi:hypothetical protein